MLDIPLVSVLSFSCASHELASEGQDPMSATRRRKMLHGAALGGLLLLALGLRLHRLGRLSLWTDEGHAVWYAAQPLEEYPRLAVSDTCLPLHYLLTRPFVLASRSDAVVRLPAVFFGVASIAVVWALGRQLGGSWLGLLAGLLVAVNPLHLRYSQEARMYTMYVFFLGLAALLLLRFMSRPGWRVGALLAGAVIGAAYSHDVSVLWVATMVAVLIPAGLLTRRQDAPPIRRSLVGLAFVALAVVAALLPWMRLLSAHVANVGRPDWWIDPPTAYHLGSVCEHFLFPWPPSGERAGACAVFGSDGFARFHALTRQVWIGLLAAGFLAAVVRRRWRLAAVGLWGVLGVVSIIAVSAAWASLIGPRIWLPMVMPMALLEAGALVLPWGARWAREERWLRVGYLTAAVAAVASVLVLSGFGVWSWYHCERKEDWRYGVSVVADNCHRGDVVFTCEQQSGGRASGGLEQKVVAWYLEQHGFAGALKGVPAAYFKLLDPSAGRFDAPPIQEDLPDHQLQRIRRQLAAGGRIWYLRRTHGEPKTRPPVIDWLDRHAAGSRSWSGDFCAVTLHWGLKEAANE